MCGIAGWYRRGGHPVEERTIAAQCRPIYHRGPDDEGVLVDEDFGFGMRRLSIIDIAGGHQPIFSSDRRYAIVCNGEIVNHRELRAEIGAGYAFKTNSDVETLLASFILWGDDAWLKAEGMYAAAIWDRRDRRLSLARDPLGIKPLFFSEQHQGLAFASEIPALKAIPELAFTVDERGVDDFFCFGHVLGPRTIFREVNSLTPGHVLTLGPSGAARVERFWQPKLQIVSGRTEREWIEETRARVLETVERHMIADVPVGAFLSGGIDSGAVAAAMSRVAADRPKLFTAGFPGSRIDETHAASRIAQHLNCEHIVLPIEQQTAADVLPLVQRSFDEPSAANSAIPLWYLSRAAAQHVKVVLCGEGGDELFLGYNRQRWAERMRRASPLVNALGMGFLDWIPDLHSRRLNYLRDYAIRFRDGARLHSGSERFFAAVTITPPNLREQIYSSALWNRSAARSTIRSRVDESLGSAQHDLRSLDQFVMGDLTVHMPASLLQRLDRASMAHSLEARVPFLSHRFVDFALSIPPELKLKNGVGKYVLRQAVKPWLPPAASGGRKLGFQMPLADWFTGGFSDFAQEAWRSSGAADAGFLDPAAVDRLFDDHRLGKRDHGRLLYAIAMFSCWWNDQRTTCQRSNRPEAAHEHSPSVRLGEFGS